MRVYGTQWITFWEAPNFDEGDDSLWIAPPGAGFMWNINNLHVITRPHGNNQWGDRIRGASFSGVPGGSNENRTILHEDGHWTVGNSRFTAEEFREALGISAQKASLHSAIDLDDGLLVKDLHLTDGYDRAFEATQDTEWISNPNSPNPQSGTLAQGDRVYFSREPSTIGATWQDAKPPDDNIRFVHPMDFQPV